MRLGIAADHAGFELKEHVKAVLTEEGHTLIDFGPESVVEDDDFPDYVAPLARSVARGEVERGLAICGSGVGACIAANKIPGVRAALITDPFSARQGVEDDAMNIICLGAAVVAPKLALVLARAFLNARYTGEPRFERRLKKIAALEQRRPEPGGAPGGAAPAGG